MAFLTLNGTTVPVEAPDGAIPAFEDTEAMDRAPSGALRQSRTYAKRALDLRTPIIAPEDADFVYGLIRGLGHRFSFDSDFFSGKGLGPVDLAVPAVATIRNNESGLKYGGALAVESGTTNLLSSNVATGTDTGGNTTGFTAVDGATIASSTAAFWQGAKSLRVTTSGTVNGVRGGVQTNAVAAVAATQYYGSVYLKAVSGTPTVRVYVRDTVNATNGTATTQVLNTTDWIRVTATHTMGGGSPQVALFIEENTADSAIDFYCDGLQIEQKAFATSWVDGTRGTPSFKIDLLDGAVRKAPKDIRDAQDLTVMFWAKQPAAGSNNVAIALAANNASPFGSLFQVSYNAGSMEFKTTASDGTTNTISWSPTWSGTWQHFCFVIHRTGRSGVYYSKVGFQNGTGQASSQTYTHLPTPSEFNFIRVGEGLGLSAWEGLIDDLVILPYALPTTLATGVCQPLIDFYNLGPFSDLPDLKVGGDAVAPGVAQAITCQGQMRRMKFVIARQGGVLLTRNRTFDFALRES